MADEAARRTLVHNERQNFAATLFNNVAVAFVATGLVVPLVAFKYGNATPHSRFWATYALIWLAMAVLNHQVARGRLARMLL